MTRRTRKITNTSAKPSPAQWVQARERKAARREGFAHAASITGFLLMLVVVALQFAVGIFRRTSYSAHVVDASLGAIVVVVIALVIAPKLTIKAIEKFTEAFGMVVSNVMLSVLLGTLYLLTLPFTKIFGAKSFAARHPGGKAWVGSGNWQGDSTWVPKSYSAELSNRRVRSPFLRALQFFVAQKNWLLFVVVLIVLLLGSLFAFATSPVIAPFIYPLF